MLVGGAMLLETLVRDISHHDSSDFSSQLGQKGLRMVAQAVELSAR